MRRILFVSLFFLAGLGGAVLADTVIETFEDGENPSGWTYGVPHVIETSGGNPGRYLHPGTLDTFAPQARTMIGEHNFSGDYSARGVVSVGIDLITHAVPTAGGRDLSIILINDNGSPSDTSDDYGAFLVGPENIPFPGEGWKSYDFDIPSQETVLPTGWKLIDFSGGGSPPGDWIDVITDVDRVLFFYGDPEFFYIFQQWDVGLDNPRITCDPEPVVECGVGAVNAGCGATEDVLLLNGSAGGGGRVVLIGTADAMSLTIDEPSSGIGDGRDAKACVYAWIGEPGDGDIVTVPKGLGTMCFGPLLIATKNPKKIWNAIGFESKLGTDNAPGDPPAIPDGGSFELLSLPGGLGRTLTVTFQGLVEDGCTQGTVPYSVTNGFVVRIRD